MSKNIDLNKFTCKCGACEWVILYIDKFEDGKHYLVCDKCHTHETYPIKIEIRGDAQPLDLIHEDWN